MGYSGAGGKLIHEKNQLQKISWHCPFKKSRHCLVSLYIYIFGPWLLYSHPTAPVSCPWVPGCRRRAWAAQRWRCPPPCRRGGSGRHGAQSRTSAFARCWSPGCTTARTLPLHPAPVGEDKKDIKPSGGQCCGSGMFIPDSNFLYPGSWIPDPKKWFLSSRKYDPGCSSRIRVLIFYPSRIPDPGVKTKKLQAKKVCKIGVCTLPYY